MPLILLDTGDSCLLVRAGGLAHKSHSDDERHSQTSYIVQVIEALYQELDIVVDVIPTRSAPTEQQFDLICDTFGRIIVGDAYAALQTEGRDALLAAIDKVLEYDAVRRQWGGASTSLNNSNTRRRPFEHRKDMPASDSCSHHVLYHNGLQVALVWQGSLATIYEICMHCPEFSLEAIVHPQDQQVRSSECGWLLPFAPLETTATLDNATSKIEIGAGAGATVGTEAGEGPLVVRYDASAITSTQVADMLRITFHKRACARSLLREKLGGFKALYGSECGNCTNAGTKASPSSDLYAAERRAVFQQVRTLYTLSNDEAQRMRASELYSRLSNLMCVENTVPLQRRLAGYLLELGLTKKRFADGYSYFGITPKFLGPRAPAAAGIVSKTLEEIEEQRRKEHQAWLSNSRPVESAPAAPEPVGIVEEVHLGGAELEGVAGCAVDTVAGVPLTDGQDIVIPWDRLKAISAVNPVLKNSSHDLRTEPAIQCAQSVGIWNQSSLARLQR